MSRKKTRPMRSGGKAVNAPSPANVTPIAAPPPDVGMAARSRAGVLTAWLPPLLLAVIGVAAYFNSFLGVFLLDDTGRIVGNPQIRELWPPWEALGGRRPVLQISLALNYALGRVDPWGYHAFNLAVHVLAGLVLFGIVRRMLESGQLEARHGATARGLALAVAAIWLVHPLQTESVTYVIQRAESLMGLFFLLTLYCGIRFFRSSHARPWGTAAVVACVLGMGSKEVMVSAPLVVWLYDRLFISRTVGETLRRHGALYAGLAATWLLLLASWAANREEETYIVAGITPWTYAATQCEVIVHYLRLALWPSPLVFDYAWPIAEPLASVVPSALIVLALLAATVLALWRRMWVGFWGGWFFLTLAPTSSIMPIADLAFEHRMYLPLAAVVATVVIGGHQLLGQAAHRMRMPVLNLGWLQAGLWTAAVALLGYATVQRNDDYRSELAMWGDTVAKRPGNPRAHLSLGKALFDQGKLDEAIAQYNETLRLKPDYAEGHYSLGAILHRVGKLDEAIAHDREAVRLKPDYAEARNNLGVAMIDRGQTAEAVTHLNEAIRLKRDYAEAQLNLAAALYRQGKLDDAIAHYREALRLAPDSLAARFNLAFILVDQEQYEEAIGHLKQVLRVDARYKGARSRMGIALQKQGKVDEAIAQYNEELRLYPQYAEAQYQLGSALIDKGRLDDAVAHLNEALRLKPGYAEAHNNLGGALYRQGKVNDAIARYREATRLKPDYAGAHYNLGSALMDQGRTADAIAHLLEALRLDPNDSGVHNNLGIALHSQGKVDDAIAHFATAARLNPDLAEARDNLRKAKAGAGDVKALR